MSLEPEQRDDGKAADASSPGKGIFAGRSEMHARVNAHPWATTPVGPVATWPQSLKSTVKTLLSSRYPMVLIWGPQFTQFYNDAYSELIGDRHPAALGIDIRITLAEAWDTLGPMIDEVMRTGVANWTPALPLEMKRAGYREEAYFSVSHAPAENDEGGIVGMLAVCSEVTQQVLSERRTRLLRDLALRAGATQSVEATCQDIAAAISSHPLDVPFALVYLRGEDGKTLELRAAIGIDEDHPGGPAHVELQAAGSVWPFDQAMQGESVLVNDVDARISMSAGFFGDPLRSALVMPLASSDPRVPAGVVVVGLSPNRELDEGYRSFCELLVGQVSVALRNARTYEEERRRAEALAELDRAKTAFFSNVSHEFRTPLTLMLGPLEDALSDGRAPLAEAQRERVALALRNGNRLFKLVNSLLDYSRLEAGRVRATFQPVDLGALTTQLASHFESAARSAGLSLSVVCPVLPEPVWVDVEAWQKVVFNLLSNALKHTFSGSVTVSLRREGNEAQLRVRDTGTGISPQELPHIFERFHRVEGARARTHEGSGIGLALVKELVALHRGRVDVDSEVDRGSVFTVCVPLGHAHLPADQKVAADGSDAKVETARAAPYVQEALGWLPREPVGTPPPSGALANAVGEAAQPLGRVLIVDDNADLRDYLGSTLSPLFAVESVADGQAALEAVRVRPPDVVVTDVMMPRLSGFGLLRALRESPATRALPVVMLSARAGEEASIEGMDAGADDYLAKPFSARELVARVRSVLELSRMRRDLSRQEALAEGLREAVRARDAFLSVAGHELKTPLAAFRLQLELLERGLSSDTDSRLVDRLSTAGRHVSHLSGLVEGLLTVSELAAGRLELRRSEVDLSVLVQEMAAEMKAEFARAGCSATVHVEPEVLAPCDRQRMAHALTSLIRHALRLAPGRPLEISLQKEGAAARLSVSGHGRSVSPEERARIFGDFERAVPTDHYSSGLDVWVARQVVQAHAGAFEVTDTSGGGPTFNVLLPLVVLDGAIRNSA